MLCLSHVLCPSRNLNENRFTAKTRPGDVIDEEMHQMKSNARRCRYGTKKIIVVLVVVSSITRMLFSLNTDFRFPMVSPSAVNLTATHCNVTNRRPSFLIGEKRMSGGRLGNDLFVYASVLGIAARNHMIPIYESDTLRSIFKLTLRYRPPEVEGTCSLTETSAFQKDSQFDDVASSCGPVSSRDVTIVGFFQSWKYFWDVRSTVRRRLIFRSEIRNMASRFLRDIGSFVNDVVYIGVHIRRTDMLAAYNVDKGYSVADVAYLERAVVYIKDKLREQRNSDRRPLDVVFVVCSDDIRWSKKHFSRVLRRTSPVANTTHTGHSKHRGYRGTLDANASPFEEHLEPSRLQSRSLYTNSSTETKPGRPSDDVIRSVQAVYSEDSQYVDYTFGGQDLAILSQCNHTIMTVGTYGWWAGYLSGGITTYYKDSIRPYSDLDLTFSHDEFYPPEWIGL